MVESRHAATSNGSNSSLVLRTVELPGRRTSLKLEPLMWAALDRVCEERDLSPGGFIAEVEERRLASSLTSAVRVALLEHFWRAAETARELRQAG
jgi:predicted DNA-binding ribbon-helix-helix protein